MTNKRFLSLLLTVAMLLTASVSVLSAVVSAVESTVTEVSLSKPQAVVTQTDIMMNVGSDETERNFVWYCNSTEGTLELAMRNGDTFFNDCLMSVMLERRYLPDRIRHISFVGCIQQLE